MLDWIGRTLLLVLSGLATFALFASFTTITSSVDPTPPRPRVTEVTPADTAPEPAAPPTERRVPEPEAPEAEAQGTSTLMTAESAAVAAQTGGIARWLEALTYAVLALAGFAAAGLVVLLRITGYLGQIARRA
jgi:hypothetical protein